MCAGHKAAEDLAAARIVANEFQEKAGDAVEKEIGAEHLSIELFAREQPHKDEKICQLDRGFEKLRGLERDPQGCLGIRLRDGVGESHAPEMIGRLAIAAARGKAAHAPDGVSQGQSGSEGVPGRERRHVVLAHVPGRGRGRADQASGEDAAGLQGRPTENVAGMGGVVAPVVNDVKDFGADDAAKTTRTAEVPGVVAD